MPELKIDKPTLIWQMPFESESAWPMAVTFVGANRVAAGNQDGQLFVWELPSAPTESKTLWPIRRLDGHTNGITRLVATPEGTLISASLDHMIRLWDLNATPSGKAEVVMDAEARQAEFKKTRKDEVLKRPGVSVETQTAAHVLDAHKNWIQSLGLSHDGKRLISGDDSAEVIVWDLATRQPLKRWSGHKWNWIAAAALSPDGETAIVSEHRYKRDDFDIPAAGLKLWSVGDGSVKLDVLKVQFPKLRSDESSYEAAQLWRKFVAAGLIAADGSPDGKLFALAQGGETETGKVHLIKTETGELARSVSAHLNGVTDVKFSADGKHLLSSGRDTTIRICQVEDGKEVAVLGTPRGGQFKDWFSALACLPINDSSQPPTSPVRSKFGRWMAVGRLGLRPDFAEWSGRSPNLQARLFRHFAWPRLRRDLIRDTIFLLFRWGFSHASPLVVVAEFSVARTRVLTRCLTGG